MIGRVRRRFFRAGGATAVRTEVVAERVVPEPRSGPGRARPLAERRRGGVGAADRPSSGRRDRRPRRPVRVGRAPTLRRQRTRPAHLTTT